MNNLPRQKLRQIIAKHGKEICSDARRCENLLNDLCGSYRREINVLVNAIEERIPLDLLAAGSSMPLEVLLKRLKKRLEENTALTSEAAAWAVDSWALALNLATDAEIEAIEKREKSAAAPPLSNAGTNQPNNSVNKAEIPNPHQRKPVQRNQTPPQAQRSRVNPPVAQSPPRTQPVFPPMVSPANNPPVIQSPAANPPVVAKRGFGLFRGCLFVIILLILSSIVLFFGVPYAIEVMRETQRQRNSEPPRFPAR